MEDEIIPISYLNDFTFCPPSIYFHMMMDGLDRTMSQSSFQINGTAAHKSIDGGIYSTRNTILQGKSVYSEELGLYGTIDLFDTRTGMLTERKKHVNQIFDGYRFQLFAQCYALREAGYEVSSMRVHSLDDNRIYPIPLPEGDPETDERFRSLIQEIREFRMGDDFVQNETKCSGCIYRPMCFYSEE